MIRYVTQDNQVYTYTYIYNLPVNWPRLLRPFQNVFYQFFMCICSECHSTLFPVQRSKILYLLIVFYINLMPMSQGASSWRIRATKAMSCVCIAK